MSKCKVVLASMVFLVFFTYSARASIVGFNADEPPAKNSAGVVAISAESTDGTKAAKSSSVFSLSSSTTNNTSFEWTAYLMELDPAGSATFVPGTASSSVFNTATDINVWTIRFEAPASVLPNQSVTFNMEISILDPPPHTYTLTQTPIPEPATVALLGIGALALVARKRQF